MKQVFDPIRQQWLKANPEEIVRQELLKQMIETLGFPKDLLVVEKSLREILLSCPESSQVPQRRIDILSYFKDPKEGLQPLLLIECKSLPIERSAIEQVKAYNYYLKARFFAVANQREVFTAFFNSSKNEYSFFKGLLPYKELLCLCGLKSKQNS